MIFCRNVLFRAHLLLLFCVQMVSNYSCAQSFNSTTGYVGISTNVYNVGLTPFDIYRYDRNHSAATSNKMGSLDWAPGVVAGINLGENDVRGKVEVCINRRSVNATYMAMNSADSSQFEVREKLKYSHNLVKVGMYYVPKKFERFCVGATLDLGYFHNKRKRIGGLYSGNWELFFTNVGLINDYKSNALIAGIGFYASYLASDNIQFTITKQNLLMDASFNYPGTFREVFMNTQHLQFSIAYVL